MREKTQEKEKNRASARGRLPFRCFQKMHMKILALCLGCALAALLLQTFLFQQASSDLIYTQSKEEMGKSLENLQDDMYSLIKTMESGMIDIYNENDFVLDLKAGRDISYMRDEYYRLAFDLGTGSFDTSSAVVALYLYNMDHEIISTYRRAVTPKHNYPTDIYEDGEFGGGEKVREYVESDNAVTLITSYYNPYREKNILRFVLKIYTSGTNSETIGDVVCDADIKVIQYLMEKYRINDDAFIWLQPEGDAPVYQLGDLGNQDEEKFRMLAESIEAGGEAAAQLFSHSDRVFFKAAQNKYNLSAYALMPQSLLRENQRTLTRNLFLIAGLVIVLAVLISAFISRTLSRPLERMTATVKQIRDGDTRLRITDCKEDELGELGRSFNEMLDRIENLVSREYEAKLLLKQAEYNALQAQINPHFLYNTLDTMSSIADIRGCPEVSSLSQSLSNIFRYSLDMKNPFSTVAGEIVHLKNYIYVMNVRMQENVEYVFDVEDSILKSTMPRISIQPLVENALTHGLRGSRKKKKIVITAGKDGENLVISVEDNGIGIPEEERRELLNPDRKNHTKSIGLNNIHSRMKILYGESYGVTIESRIGEGTKVSLVIPSVRMEEIDIWKAKNTKY